MPVQHKYDEKEKSLTISITENFNFDTHAKFRDAYRDLKPEDVKSITVNLRNASYMDSSALGMLLLLDEEFPDIRISISNCPEYIQQVLDVSNFHQKFDIS